MRWHGRTAAFAAAVLFLAPAAAPLHGQQRSARAEGACRSRPREDPAELNLPYDGRFTFARLRYRSELPGRRRGFFFGRGGGPGWSHDWPRAECHLSRILAELTTVVPNTDGGVVLAADDPALFRYPIAYLSEPGAWTLTDAEATNLSNYLRKGGFLIIDDFAGYDWDNFEHAIRQVLPDARLVPLDASHPIFNVFYAIESLDHTHPYMGVRAEYFGIFEENAPDKRLMVIVNYNNDIGESWEWSDTGFIPIDITNEAYRLGVNYIIYAMTH